MPKKMGCSTGNDPVTQASQTRMCPLTLTTP